MIFGLGEMKKSFLPFCARQLRNILVNLGPSFIKVGQVMLDTVGSELQVVNKSEQAISLEADACVTLTPDQSLDASSELLPINFGGLAKAVKPGDTIFIGQYLFTGSETTSVWLEVKEVKGDDVVCVINNSATLAGSLFTLHVSQTHIDLPTPSDADKEGRKQQQSG